MERKPHKPRAPVKLEITAEGLIKLPPANSIAQALATNPGDRWAETEARLAGEKDEAKPAEIAHTAREAAIDADLAQMLAERPDGLVSVGELYYALHLIRHRLPQVLGDRIASLLEFIIRQAGAIQSDRFWLMWTIHRSTGLGLNACARLAAKEASNDPTRDIRGSMATFKGAYYEEVPKHPGFEIAEDTNPLKPGG